jgi:hypothetical protein
MGLNFISRFLWEEIIWKFEVGLIELAVFLPVVQLLERRERHLAASALK